MDNLFFQKQGILLKQRKFKSNKVAFVFPGHGSQYKGMFSKFHNETFRNTMRIADSEYKKITGKSLIHLIESDAINKPEVMQPAIFATEVAMFKSLKERDIISNVLIGHSFGEISALCCGGVFDVKTGIDICIKRAKILNTLKPDKSGFMIAVRSEQRELINNIIRKMSLNSVEVAIKNTKKNTVYSGQKVDILRFRKSLKQNNIGSKLLTSIPFPFHSPLLREQSSKFEKMLNEYEFHYLKKDIEVYSTILGRKYEEADIKVMPKIIASQLVTPFDFENIILDVYKSGVNTFIECGPSNVLNKLISKILESKSSLILSTNTKGEDSNFSFLRACSEFILNYRGKIKMADSNKKAENYLVSATGYPHSLVKSLLENYNAEDDIRKYFAVPEDIAEKLKKYLINQETLNDKQNKENINEKIKRVIAEETGYPEEILEENADFEADLGIDSVKLSEILSKLSKKFKINLEGKTNKKFNTIRDIIACLPNESEFTLDKEVDKVDVEDKIRTVIEKLTGYPKDVLENNARFEADLGIDLDKKKEIFNQVASLYGLDNQNFDSANTIQELASSIKNLPVEKSINQEQSGNKEQISEDKVKQIIAEETGYPVEILNSDADLEADLGIDSVKKGEILGKLSSKFDDQIVEKENFEGIETIQDIITFFQKKK